MKINKLKVVFLLLTTCLSNTTFSQIFVEANTGLYGSFDPRIFSKSSIGLGIGYMHDDLIGLKADFVNVDLSNSEGSSRYKRIDLQLVANLSNAFFDKSYYDHFFVLAHTGMGISSLKVPMTNASDKNLNFTFGLSPKYKIAPGLDITSDASFTLNFNQNYNYDGTPTYKNLAIPQTGLLFNLSLGLMYTFGNYRY